MYRLMTFFALTNLPHNFDSPDFPSRSKRKEPDLAARK